MFVDDKLGWADKDSTAVFRGKIHLKPKRERKPKQKKENNSQNTNNNNSDK